MRSTNQMLTSSSKPDVGAGEAVQGTLVGCDTHILKDEGTVQEEQVVHVWAEGRGQGGVQGKVGSS